mmetsp:Transcript_11818/g.29916  ORF Transcript_11818/g.29916 Transcript_11818/m.29916 type:complete len:380 (+) Transcript_11818:881-2020(+)
MVEITSSVVSDAKVESADLLVIPGVLQPQRPHRGVDPHAHPVAVPAAGLASAAGRVAHHSGPTVNVAAVVRKESPLERAEKRKVELAAAHDVVPPGAHGPLPVPSDGVRAANGEGLVRGQVADDHASLRGDHQPRKACLDRAFCPYPEPVEVEEVLLHWDGLLHGHHQLRLVPAVDRSQHPDQKLVVVLVAENDRVAVIVTHEGLAVLPEDPRPLVLHAGRAAQRGAEGPAVFDPAQEPPDQDAALVAGPRSGAVRVQRIRRAAATIFVHGLPVNGVAARAHVLQVRVPARPVLVPADPRIRVVDPKERVRLADLDRGRELLILSKEVPLRVGAAPDKAGNRALAALARRNPAACAEPARLPLHHVQRQHDFGAVRALN